MTITKTTLEKKFLKKLKQQPFGVRFRIMRHIADVRDKINRRGGKK